MEELKRRLLEIGGKDVLLPESIPESLYKYGHVYSCKVVVPVGGASRYYLSNEGDVNVIWGFVLDKEGIWMVHSWLVHADRPIIIDSEEYEKYFGFEI